MRKSFLFIMLFIGVLAHAQQQRTILLTNANIVDVMHNRTLPAKLILIRGDSIVTVDDMRNSSKYKAQQMIDLHGQYVMPGLWDTHVHFRGGDSLIAANKRLLPLFLYYGVTTVRECGGDMTSSVMQWREQIATGTLMGPRIFTSGPKIDGPKPTWAGSLEVVNKEDVSHALDSLQQMKVDFVKIYDSKISRDAFLETIAQAEARGLKTSGHMPYTVRLREAVDRGLDASEHLYYVAKACAANEDSLTNAIIASQGSAKPVGLFAALPSVINGYNPKIAVSLFRYLASKKFSIVPTLFISKVLDEIKTSDHTRDSLLRYVDKGIQSTYAGRVNIAKRQTAEGTAFAKRFAAFEASLVAPMQHAGVNIIAGSDCGAFNSFVYPGESIHEEIKMMKGAGLTNAEALRTATINGAKFLGVDAHFGDISRGKCSDMIVLSANPLNDVRNIDAVTMVVSHGQVYPRAILKKMLDEAVQ
jgi:imidazolonepropionase-like amidohydrolase